MEDPELAWPEGREPPVPRPHPRARLLSGGRRISRQFKVVRACILCLFFSSILHLAPAQSATGGSVAGQITGPSGNSFRALVTLRNIATGTQLQPLSDARGTFRFPEVAPGNYAVRVNAPGAAPWRASSVTVEIGRITPLSP